MNDRPALFDDYLTRHLSHAADPLHSRERRKALLAHNYVRLLPKDRRAAILDVGPGYGELLELLAKDLGYRQTTAIDISKEVVEHCNTILPGSTALVSDTRDFFEANADKFDCVFLLHVLEHIPKQDTIPLLRAIHSALAPNGRLIIEVPNMLNPFTGNALRYMDFTHEVGYTELSLEYVLQMAGFSQIAVAEIKFPIDRPARVLQNVLYGAVKLTLFPIFKAYRMPGKMILSAALSGTGVK